MPLIGIWQSFTVVDRLEGLLLIDLRVTQEASSNTASFFSYKFQMFSE